jgi:hypothetical protein
MAARLIIFMEVFIEISPSLLYRAAIHHPGRRPSRCEPPETPEQDLIEKRSRSCHFMAFKGSG